MNLIKERKTIDALLDAYRARLDSIPDGKFTETPPDGGWSYAEVYSHILQATLGASMGMERCIHANGAAGAKGINLLGRMVLAFGRFPPVKIKVPEKLAAKMPALKISKEDAKNLIVKCRMRVNDMAPLLKDSPQHARVKHPRLGSLNAKQWFKFIRIHLKHHLKQLDRITNNLRSV